MKTPSQVKEIHLETTCVNCSGYNEWDNLMEGHTRANKTLIDSLVKKHLPELYNDLCLNFHNPYFYYKTEKHLILVHSSIEYFLSYRIN